MRRGAWAALGLTAAAAVLIFVLARGFGRDPHEVPFMLKGKPAPDFSLRRLDTGETVSLSSLRGRPVVLNFWASWCGPCQEDHPVLARGAHQLGDQARFFGVVFEDTEENARAFAAPMQPEFPQLFDARSRTSVDYGVTGVPETYFIDAAGVIREKFIGPMDARSLAQRVRALGRPPQVSEAAR